jgi:hypothetical protein
VRSSSFAVSGFAGHALVPAVSFAGNEMPRFGEVRREGKGKVVGESLASARARECENVSRAQVATPLSGSTAGCTERERA